MDLMAAFDELDGKKGEVIHSPINYPGNKLELMDWILDHLPQSKKFVDVFGGSAQVLISKSPSDLEVYNDLNNGLTTFFKVLQDQKKMKDLFDRAQILIHSKQMFEEFKDSWQTEQDDVTKALMFYYIIQASHLSKGMSFGKVSKGKADIYRKLNRYLPLFGAIHNRIYKVQIENMDFRKLIPAYDDYDAVFYCDPPYYESNEYANKMSRVCHKDLLDLIFKSRGYFAVSGYKSDLYGEYPWHRVEMTTLRTNAKAISGSGDFKNIQSRTSERLEYLYIKEVG